jgi:hypothetical protein
MVAALAAATLTEPKEECMRFHTMGGGCGLGSAWAWPGAGFFWMGPGWPCGPNRDRWIRMLEDYQNDLEQAAADVADLIRRIREDAGSETTNV